METDEIYMSRCIELATLGAGNVAPNPMVGCVIVYNGKIIGEGFHQKYGQAHAEVNAVNSVTDRELLKSSVMYVSLEPCAHHGLTPPCADLIIREQIPKVVIGTADPFAEVAGKGLKGFKMQEWR
jgi:diaminohydroxyphosphoribosylaminopyrimidine deaminase / 5-amino-6-(5-phosphoribosylamino)uracil reductase